MIKRLEQVAALVVAAGLAARCQVQVSYAIGVARPPSVMVTTFGTGRIPDDQLARLVQEHVRLMDEHGSPVSTDVVYRYRPV